MGAKKKTPRYNVICCRVNDATWDEISAACGHGIFSHFLRSAIEAKLIEERQAAIDATLRNA